MACDLATLATADTGDPEQMMLLIDQCTKAVTDPKLWFWALVLTIACGAVGAWIGKHKNAVKRDALLGAALGPIGWIISLCLPARSNPPPKKSKRNCPACRKEIDPGDAHCRHCGAKLSAG